MGDIFYEKKTNTFLIGCSIFIHLPLAISLMSHEQCSITHMCYMETPEGRGGGGGGNH